MADAPTTKAPSARFRRKGGKAGDGATAATVKTRIIEVALQAFSQYGFDGAALSEMARQCGVSQPLVHYHFSSKTQLWQEVVTAAMDEVYRELAYGMSNYVDLDVVSKFKIFLRGYISLTYRRPYIFAIIIKESDILSDRFEWLRDQLLPKFYQIWEREIQVLKSGGFIQSKAPDYHIAQIVVGACNHYLFSRYRVLPLYELDPDDPNLPRQHADLVIDILLNGLLSAPRVA